MTFDRCFNKLRAWYSLFQFYCAHSMIIELCGSFALDLKIEINTPNELWMTANQKFAESVLHFVRACACVCLRVYVCVLALFDMMDMIKTIYKYTTHCSCYFILNFYIQRSVCLQCQIMPSSVCPKWMCTSKIFVCITFCFGVSWLCRTTKMNRLNHSNEWKRREN